MRTKTLLVNWGPEVERQIKIIGQDIERYITSMTHESKAFPHIAVKRRGGEYNFSMIIEASLLKLVRDLKSLADNKISEYTETYKTIRDTNNKKNVHISEASIDAMETVSKALQGKGIGHLFHGKRRNDQLLISIALQYTSDQILLNS